MLKYFFDVQINSWAMKKNIYVLKASAVAPRIIYVKWCGYQSSHMHVTLFSNIQLIYMQPFAKFRCYQSMVTEKKTKLDDRASHSTALEHKMDHFLFYNTKVSLICASIGVTLRSIDLRVFDISFSWHQCFDFPK